MTLETILFTLQQHIFHFSRFVVFKTMLTHFLHTSSCKCKWKWEVDSSSPLLFRFSFPKEKTLLFHSKNPFILILIHKLILLFLFLTCTFVAKLFRNITRIYYSIIFACERISEHFGPMSIRVGGKRRRAIWKTTRYRILSKFVIILKNSQAMRQRACG